MLNSLVGIFLGCVHEYVQEQYIPICDAVLVPTLCTVMLCFVCGFCIAFVHSLTAVIAHDANK